MKEIETDIKDESPTKFEMALEKAGSWGIWQKKMLLVISAAQVFSAMHSVAAVFLSATPRHRCQLPEVVSGLSVYKMIENISIPESSSCTLYAHDFEGMATFINASRGIISQEELGPFLNNNTVECQDWVYENTYFQSTAVTEWNLVCSRKLLKSTVQATFMGGILIGSILFGQVSDRIGRRKTMVFCSVCLLIVSVGVVFVQSYIAFITLRFAVALLCAGLMTTNFVLLMEITRPEARTFTGMMNGVPFGLGISSIGFLAYFIRDWRYLEMAIGVSGGSLLLYFWFLPESPRWLASKGNPKEALKVLKTIAKDNNKILPADEDMLFLLSEAQNCDAPEKISLATRCFSFFLDQATLVRTPIMRRRCLIGFFTWFVSAMIYYGLIFSGSNIKANPYLMVVVSGLVEVPSFIAASYALLRFGRRITSCSLFFMCGFILVLLIAVPSGEVYAAFTLANLGKLFNTAVFQLCYLYTSELVPTGVRNIAVGTSSMFARIGSSVAPYVLDVLGEVHYTLPSMVFGIFSLSAGLLTLLLPETMNKPLPQTVEEVESAKR